LTSSNFVGTSSKKNLQVKGLALVILIVEKVILISYYTYKL